ncbi:hypothetical protein LEP3755_48360 [Leptolyngbya sp. NIES-3755]|nr:hypothetical protein LEP3755_48360 [Leptolyngbya sp. NIES-3755]
MSESTSRATRATVMIGNLSIDGFMLPDGTYRMSQAQAAAAIDEAPVYALRFLQSKDSKALLGEAYTDYTPESVEVESDPGKRGQTRINALPIQVVTAYWLTRAFKGNKKAFVMSWALLTESLERRFDTAFGVNRTDDDFNQRLSDRVIAQLENDLGEALSGESVSRNEIEYLMQILRYHGIDPYQLPQDEET